jgi:hypothetical protein
MSFRAEGSVRMIQGTFGVIIQQAGGTHTTKLLVLAGAAVVTCCSLYDINHII